MDPEVVKVVCLEFDVHSLDHVRRACSVLYLVHAVIERSRGV